MKLLLDRLGDDSNSENGDLLNQGVLLSREQYLPDIEDWGYQDARLEPRGKMSGDKPLDDRYQ
ncbi:MAG: hypothetical protein K2Z81_25365 [Cyanobacteria bacterium]|nr:hypothetical protein [Cyanobacteriota bacterium]